MAPRRGALAVSIAAKALLTAGITTAVVATVIALARLLAWVTAP